MSFKEFYREINNWDPFPWQAELVEYIQTNKKFPDNLNLPTAAGKTSIIDILVYLLAMESDIPPDERIMSRRMWFIVNRRIVVDQAFEHGSKIANMLKNASSGILFDVAQRLKSISGSDTPLLAVQLRGGMHLDTSWKIHFSQPMIISSTLDMYGSRLLFRGYGCTKESLPINAALAGTDSCVIIDEAHTATALATTVRSVVDMQKKYGSYTPFNIIEMTATPTNKSGVQFPNDGFDHGKILNDRFSCVKPAYLSQVNSIELFMDSACELVGSMVNDGYKRISVMVNSVNKANACHNLLKKKFPNADVVLFTSRQRSVDRDELVNRLTNILKPNSDVVLDSPIIVVSTQCLEAGADFSFESMVTECSALDSLRQRFGRLNRIAKYPSGHSKAYIIDIKKCSINKMIYGDCVQNTYKMLTNKSFPKIGKTKKDSYIDVGINGFSQAIATINEDEVKSCMTEVKVPWTLLEPVVIHNSLTSVNYPMKVDISGYIHGNQVSLPEVYVVFRDDFSKYDSSNWKEIIEVMPPVQGEVLPVPLQTLRDYLYGADSCYEASDLEAQTITGTTLNYYQNDITSEFMIWDDETPIITTDIGSIQNGDTIILKSPNTMPKSLGINNTTFKADVYADALKQRGQYKLHRYDTSANEDDIREKHSKSTIIPYVGGYVVFERIFKDKPQIKYPTIRVNGDVRTLKTHTDLVEQMSVLMASKIHPSSKHLLSTVAKWHDIGKLDKRFQYVLNNGSIPQIPLAKSTDKKQTKFDWEINSNVIKLPKGFRHEFLSAQIADLKRMGLDEDEHDVALHLIVTHHGKCRPISEPINDDSDQPIDISCIFDKMIGISSEQRKKFVPIHKISSGNLQRFNALTESYGPWNLAFLETLFRSADCIASTIENKRNTNGN